ncbi:RNA polymerase sigma factor SigF [Cyanobacterium aponinum UTEX 3222]|uniref:RNA polymerase, sigma 28 subunit, FliA/WhiG subfamily n=2 Tax=Cyanobacterium aponinum TaxID=379064 RepID=K9Z722_CYAAP|nr:RNA polymerase sigma factor SigF [Cyanobacterium aponinum]WRL43510.1 RNA polymerase sigma factor SigF [Cyanobacterium aponinum UTEX 3222]AFZ54542.1 RNA polymerase, sigma 28 subunit, FliA/WhiG subfamily [Cyanobacterium aponinum PCC 10605]MBD2394681.1 RNA polymerase sigma factor SigF [Cyanobacterium aponinum FACHB-4101]PHV63804.1 RNA polymerase sigma factor SigF [Cyanobacterium aponinum IPPAS B-1201]WPF88058.1 RNA polymerase sigma factor SigF [Cyanobacterium aponinum AL20115]
MTTLKTHSEYKQENEKLFVNYRQNRDLRVRNQILELNMGLVRKEVCHWLNQCQENYDDLLQVGCIGLIRAIDRYDIEKGFAFSSFAVPYVRGEIQHYLRDKGYSIRIPRRCLELKNQSNRIVRKLRNELNRQPTDQEIARELGVSLQEWHDVKLAHQNREPISLDINANDEDERSTLGDCLPDHQYRSFQLAQEDKIRLQNALSQLEDGTRKVLEFVFLQDLTQKETADILGVSVITVSRRIKKGIVKMRNLIKPDEF